MTVKELLQYVSEHNVPLDAVVQVWDMGFGGPADAEVDAASSGSSCLVLWAQDNEGGGAT